MDRIGSVVSIREVSLLMDSESPAQGRRLGRIGCAVLCGLMSWSLVGCAVTQPRGAGQLERIVEPTTQRGYWRYLPQSYVQAPPQERRGKQWPTVVSFHGLKPFDNAMPQALAWQQEADRYGYVVIAPELRAPDLLDEFPLRTRHERLLSDEAFALTAMDHLFATTDADPQYVLATGWSSGGYMAHYMLNRHPDRFYALAMFNANFSSTVLDPNLTHLSRNHPILITNGENDFAGVKRESDDAIRWYEEHGYARVAWVHLRGMGHERTPDIPADFFANVIGIEPNTPPAVLVGRQAVAGNQEGMAFFSGSMRGARSSATPRPRPQAQRRNPVEPASAQHSDPARSQADRSQLPRSQSTVAAARRGQRPSAQRQTRTARATPESTARETPRRAPAARPQQQWRQGNPVWIRLSTSFGVEPLRVGFSAVCPAEWYDVAEFRWLLNGREIATGVVGERYFSTPGDHELELRVSLGDRGEYRVSRIVRVVSSQAAGLATN